MHPTDGRKHARDQTRGCGCRAVRDAGSRCAECPLAHRVRGTDAARLLRDSRWEATEAGGSAHTSTWPRSGAKERSQAGHPAGTPHRSSSHGGPNAAFAAGGDIDGHRDPRCTRQTRVEKDGLTAAPFAARVELTQGSKKNVKESDCPQS